MNREHVGIVGAGIVGLAHAWAAAKRGHQVTVFERDPRAVGASVRNFGMIWPIGQPVGESHRTALRSRDLWLELGRDGAAWVLPCGSIHLAHRADEWGVLEEFAAGAGASGVDCRLLTADEVVRRAPGAHPGGLLGGLYSPTELGVNPREALRTIPLWLADRYGVRVSPGTPVARVEPGHLQTARGESFAFDRIVVCGGADLATLFPEILGESGLRPCKLQMLRTAPQPAGWRIGPHLASGLTLRHYKIFEVCASLPALRRRIAEEAPELDRVGIHVMASQTQDGAVILGDSHEYGDEITPFDRAEIDDLILRELRKVIQLPDWTIAERWHGVYAKHPTAPVFAADPAERVHIRTGTGGGGMTMSLALAEQDWAQRETTR